MRIIITSILIVVFHTIAFSQSLQFRSSIAWTSHQSKMKDVVGGWSAGFEVEENISGNRFFIFGLDLKKKGLKYLVTKENELQESTGYVNLSYGLRLRPVQRLHMSGGMFVGINIWNRLETLKISNDDFYFNHFSDESGHEMGVFFSIGVVNEKTNRIFGGIQFDYGIVNVKRIPGIVSRNQTLSMFVCYMFNR